VRHHSAKPVLPFLLRVQVPVPFSVLLPHALRAGMLQVLLRWDHRYDASRGLSQQDKPEY
jgi:hypothetical protein